MRDNKCIWINGLSELSDNSKDLVERGYCVNQDLSELDNLIESFWNSQLDEPNFDYNALQEEIRVRYLSHPVKIDDSIENGKVKKIFKLTSTI